MRFRDFVRPRFIVLFLLWSLPVLFYAIVATVALYQSGWFPMLLWTLPPMWLAAWWIGRLWPAPKLCQAANWTPLRAPSFWTPKDAAAIAIVEAFRNEVEDVDRNDILDPNRYLRDAEILARRLAAHYHSEDQQNALHPLTMIELISVIHLAVEDVETWLLKNIPASDLATIGHLNRLPMVARVFDAAQTAIFFATAIANPGKLLGYPLWRKSGGVTIELQNELIRGFYQRFLRQIGYYLIEMYSGRLQGGSKRYRAQFGPMAAAVHAAGGTSETLEMLDDVTTTIAVMGQVNAGKSSLINALLGDQTTATSLLPETRQVQRFSYQLPGSSNQLALLDTPGYSEADVSRRQLAEIERAADAADIVLLVLAANVSARDGDRKMLRDLMQHYDQQPHLKPPTIVAVLTHIDLLRPIQLWNPPYDWQHGQSAKEQSMAKAVAYNRELFSDWVADYACVCTGGQDPDQTSVADELVPLLIKHLDHGRSAAILKAFYRQLGQRRLKQLSSQIAALVRHLSRTK